MLLLEYRQNFYFWSVVSLMWTLFNFLIIGVMAGVSGQVGGWTLPQLTILIATYTIIDTFTWSFFYQNMWRYTAHIYDGTLSGFLVKPVDTQFLLMIQDNTFNNLPRFLLGLGTLAGAIWWWQLSISWLSWLLFGLAILTSLTFIYFLWFIISTMAFWVERLTNIHEIMPGLRQIYQLPRTIYPGSIQVVLSVIIPLGLVSSLPVELFFGLPQWPYLAYFASLTLMIVGFSRWLFKYSIRKFTSVGG